MAATNNNPEGFQKLNPDNYMTMETPSGIEQDNEGNRDRKFIEGLKSLLGVENEGQILEVIQVLRIGKVQLLIQAGIGEPPHIIWANKNIPAMDAIQILQAVVMQLTNQQNEALKRAEQAEENKKARKKDKK